tara:strand:- start:2968 stop:3489 length:522 start_codon:yes stop_codon:yes gene_type:complete
VSSTNADLYRGDDKKNKLKMKWVRTPEIIWEQLSKEFDFTVDACASDKNHLLPRYWTKETDALEQSWDNEIIYCHPMFDINIPKFVEKGCMADNSVCVFLLPASTQSVYFHRWFWDDLNHKPQANVEIRFLPKREPSNHLGYKFLSEDNEEPSMGYIRPLMVVVVDNRMYDYE